MDWTAIIIAVIGSGLITAIVNAVIRQMEKKRDDKTLEKKALRLLILGEIREYGKDLVRKCEENGGIEQMDYNHFDELYKTYKALNGDGFADKVNDEIKKLQILI